MDPNNLEMVTDSILPIESLLYYQQGNNYSDDFENYYLESFYQDVSPFESYPLYQNYVVNNPSEEIEKSSWTYPYFIPQHIVPAPPKNIPKRRIPTMRPKLDGNEENQFFPVLNPNEAVLYNFPNHLDPFLLQPMINDVLSNLNETNDLPQKNIKGLKRKLEYKEFEPNKKRKLDVPITVEQDINEENKPLIPIHEKFLGNTRKSFKQAILYYLVLNGICSDVIETTKVEFSQKSYEKLKQYSHSNIDKNIEIPIKVKIKVKESFKNDMEIFDIKYAKLCEQFGYKPPKNGTSSIKRNIHQRGRGKISQSDIVEFFVDEYEYIAVHALVYDHKILLNEVNQDYFYSKK